MIVDIQFSAAHNDWPVLRDAVLQAEADGYDTTWVFDHFDGATLGGDRVVLEPFTLLGALAACTTRIGLGTMVANVANRHPAMLAHCAHAVQRVSEGRLRLGVGGGTAPGSPWSAEHERRNITLDPALAGRQRAVVDAIAVCRAVTDAPIIVGVNSVALARHAGEHADGINVRIDNPRAAEFIEAAKAAADSRVGERPFEVSAYSLLHPDESRTLAASLGADRLILTRLRAERASA